MTSHVTAQEHPKTTHEYLNLLAKVEDHMCKVISDRNRLVDILKSKMETTNDPLPSNVDMFSLIDFEKIEEIKQGIARHEEHQSRDEPRLCIVADTVAWINARFLIMHIMDMWNVSISVPRTRTISPLGPFFF